MKRNRIIFIIAWLLSLLCISFFGGAVSYGIFFLLTVLPFISFLYLLCVFFFFRIYQEAGTKLLVVSQTVPFFFTLVNEYFFGFVSIKVNFFSSFSSIIGLDDGIEYELLPKTGIKKQTKLICRYRGEYEVGIKSVEIQDYFRLIRLRYDNKETLRVIVKPAVIALDRLKSAELINVALRESELRSEQPDVLVRDYEQGDDLRLINWKLSAGNGKLMVRRHTGEEQEGVSILFGTYRPQSDRMSYLPVENKILEAVLALTLYFAKNNIPSRTLYLNGELSEEDVTGIDRFEAFYDVMYSVSFREE